MEESKCHSKIHVVLAVFACLALLALAGWLGLKARNESGQYKFIGVPPTRDTITVSGEGKVTTIPDIANLSLGTQAERSTVTEAQRENTRVMNALLAKLDGFGVEKKDIQTERYDISPRYDYLDGKTVLRGYTVSQSVRVKVRNMEKVGDILGAAGEIGANQVGSIIFGVDEPEKLKAEARDKAILNAREKAAALAKAAGVTLRRVISVSESGNESVPRYYGLDESVMGLKAAAPAPTIEAGSSE